MCCLGIWTRGNMLIEVIGSTKPYRLCSLGPASFRLLGRSGKDFFEKRAGVSNYSSYRTCPYPQSPSTQMEGIYPRTEVHSQCRSPTYSVSSDTLEPQGSIWPQVATFFRSQVPFRVSQTPGGSSASCTLRGLVLEGPQRTHKDKDPTNQDFWNPPKTGPEELKSWILSFMWSVGPFLY